MSNDDVVIVGAGVAGCSLASLLQRRGFDVTILEKASVGGLLREIEFESGFYCDSAPHLLFFDEEAESAVGELFERYTDLRRGEFYAATYPDGDLKNPHHYPVSEENIDRWNDADQIRTELDGTLDRSDAEFFEEYVVEQVGPTLYDRYYRHYTEKHWGIDPARITGDWFDFKINFPESEQEFFGGGAYYPTTRYTEVLREMISDCEIVFDGASGLVTDGDRIESVSTEGGDEIGGDIFVSTVDPRVLLSGSDEELQYRSMVILGLHLEATDRLFPEHVDWGYFPNHYEFTRITDYEFTGQALPADEYILTVEFPCFVDDETWSRADEWCEAYTLDFLSSQGIDGDVIASEVRRARRAYPLPVRDEIETFQRLNEQLASYENIFNLGRVSSYQYIWIKDIVQQAWETLENIERSR